jgi:hypothetical protein
MVDEEAPGLAAAALARTRTRARCHGEHGRTG